MSVRRTIAGLATAALLIVATAAPAFADASATVGEVEAADGQLSFVVTLDGVPAGADIDTDNATASIEGQALAPDVQSLSDSGDVSQTTLLVMDTSDSMAGEKLTAAKDAARQFVNAVPAEVEIGLVTFDSVAEQQVAPTSRPQRSAAHDRRSDHSAADRSLRRGSPRRTRARVSRRGFSPPAVRRRRPW